MSWYELLQGGNSLVMTSLGLCKRGGATVEVYHRLSVYIYLRCRNIDIYIESIYLLHKYIVNHKKIKYNLFILQNELHQFCFVSVQLKDHMKVIAVLVLSDKWGL